MEAWSGAERPHSPPLCFWLIKALRDLLCFFYFRFISADDKEGEEYSKHASTANKKKHRIYGSFFILF